MLDSRIHLQSEDEVLRGRLEATCWRLCSKMLIEMPEWADYFKLESFIRLLFTKRSEVAGG